MYKCIIAACGFMAIAGALYAQTATPDENQKEIKELQEQMNSVTEAQTKTIPSIFNPAIGFVGETIFSYTNRGSDKTGRDRPGGFDFFPRSLELNASSSVDTFAKAYAVINTQVDPKSGEAVLEVEEAALQTTALPWNMELKAGRFFGEFGRLGDIHDHELPFVYRPMVLDQYIGGESQTDGLQFNWLVPVDRYISWTVGLGDRFGADDPNPNDAGNYRSIKDLNYWSRLSTYFEVTPDIAIEPGISGLINPGTLNRGGALLQPDGSTLTERKRQLYGADLVVSYKPLQNNQFRSLIWGTEVLYSDNKYDVNLTDSAGPTSSVYMKSLGMYSYLTFKYDREWSWGFLYEWLENAQNNKDKTSAYSPYITWALSHWNQLRLQYTYTDRSKISGLRSDQQISLQWTWIIGAHSHGWQQR